MSENENKNVKMLECKREQERSGGKELTLSVQGSEYKWDSRVKQEIDDGEEPGLTFKAQI